MKSDPGFKYSKDQVEEIVEDLNCSTDEYNAAIDKKNKEILKAKQKVFDFLNIEY